MSHQFRRQITLGALAVVLLSSSAMAQFARNAFFSTLPNSQIGIPTNNLIITNTPTGFTVTGDVTVLMAAAPPTASGILVDWVIDRPLASNFTFTNWTTSTVLSGFSTPPPGTAGNTSGVVNPSFPPHATCGPVEPNLLPVNVARSG